MRAVLVIIAVSAALLQQCRGQPAPIGTATATDFHNAVGVNLHLQYGDTPYGDLKRVEDALTFLDLQHVRDSAFRRGAEAFGRYVALAQRGVHFDLIFSSALEEQSRRTGDFSLVAPGAVEMVEGPNEINNDPVLRNGKHGVAAAQALQAALYTRFHAASARGKPVVLGYTNWPPSNGLADAVNVHSYAKEGASPFKQMSWDLALVQGSEPPRRPFYFSETGLATSSTKNQDQQAAIVLTELLDGFRLGAVRTYIYELFDEHADRIGSLSDPEDHYGLFDVSGRPKIAARDLHTLMSLSKAEGAKASPVAVKRLQVRAGPPGLTNSLALSKVDGSWILIVWREPGSRTYDRAATFQFAAEMRVRTVTLANGQSSPETSTSSIVLDRLGPPRVFLVRAG